jgi:hypothetical protein
MNMKMPDEISEGERFAIKMVLQFCSQYGYGNMLGWINTAWEKRNGMSHSSPYPLEWLDELKLTPEGEEVDRGEK